MPGEVAGLEVVGEGDRERPAFSRLIGDQTSINLPPPHSLLCAAA